MIIDSDSDLFANLYLLGLWVLWLECDAGLSKNVIFIRLY